MSTIFNVDFIGTVAGLLTTVAFFPQVIKIWQSKCADDISYEMFVIFSIGVALWGVYGWEIHALPVIVTNLVTLFLAVLIITLKFVFRKKNS